MKNIISTLTRLCGLLVVATLVQACSSGSGGSDVGNNVNILPTARAQVVNVGADNTFREGSEVLLSGVASEDDDGPILSWVWTQTGGPSVMLVERTSNVVSFTAPDVTAATTLSFQLEVTDSDNATNTASVTMNVIPAQDADGFLTLSLRSGDSRRDAFSIIPGLAAGTGQDEAFTLSVQAYLIYPLVGSGADCNTVGLPPNNVAAVPVTVGSCSVALFSDLTPGGGFSDVWSGTAPPGQPSDADGIINSVFNPRFSFRIPRVDVDDFNQQFLPDQRDQMLDVSSIDEVVVAFRVELAATDPAAAGFIVGAAAPSSNGDKGVFALEPNTGSGNPIWSWMRLGEITAQIQDAETSLTGAVYARTIDPAGKRTTLNDWLCQAGFAEPAGCEPLPVGETRRITLREDALVGASTPTEEFAHAVYMNNYDLGFGRDMYNRTEVSPTNTGNVYSWVHNYPTLEGAIRRQQPIVTVVMEYSPPEDAAGDPISGASSFTKFFTYVPDGSGDSVLVNSMNFDGRGELPTPGNCVACHGGVDPGANTLILNAGSMDSLGNMCTSASLDPVCYTYPNGGDVEATFLLWDVDSLLFADTDPAITNAPVPFDGETLLQELEALPGPIGIRRSEQLDQITRLNESALATFAQDPVRNAPGVALLEYWYGNPVDMNMNPPLIVGAFDDSGAPPDWQEGVTPAGATMANDSGSDQLYQDVYARNCRMCHTSISEVDLQFNDYVTFVTAIGCGNDVSMSEGPNPGCGGGIYSRGIMPGARLTMDRFWTDFDGAGVAGDLLETHLRAVGRIGVDTDLTPSQALANITVPPASEIVNDLTRVVPRRSIVRLSGESSDFASSFEWSEGSGYPSPGPSFIGANTEQVAFVPDTPGLYPVVLTINGSTTATTAVEVENYVPEANPDAATAQPSGSMVTIDFLGNDRFQLEVCPGACPVALTIANAPDLPITITNIVQVPDADPDGTIALQANAACTVVNPAGCADDRLIYTPASVMDTYTDSFQYTITDVDQNASTGTITIQAQQALAATGVTPTVTSDISANTFSITATGGAQAAVGNRYTVATLSDPSSGTVSGLSSFDTSDTFSYVSDEFETGAESFSLRVSDTATPANTVDVLFSFTIQPQDAFDTMITMGRPTVTQIVRGQAPAGTSCAASGCHDGTAGRPDYTVANLYAVVNGLVNRTNGNVNVDSSLILCVPTGACSPSNGTAHDGGTGLYDAIELSVITRWLQEGAQNN